MSFLSTLLKGVNEIYFIVCSFGVIYIAKTSFKREKWLHITAITLLLLMLGWRYFIRIDSSRYVSLLIVPVSIISAVYISKKQSGNRFYGVFKVLLLAFFLVLVLRKDFVNPRRNSCSIEIAELFERVNKGYNHYSFVVQESDCERIKYYSNVKGGVSISNLETSDVRSYINMYEKAYLKTLLVSTSKDEKIMSDATIKTKSSLVLSSRPYRDSRKTYHVFLLNPKSNCFPVSQNKIHYEENLLNNGNLEAIDSPEESYDKFKSHVKDYSMFYSVSSELRTPANAYFYCTSDLSHYPVFKSESQAPIDGAHSVTIDFKDGYIFFLFFSRFQNGKYQFSFLVRGNTNTEVIPVTQVHCNKKWSTNQLSTFVLPDKRLYKVEVDYSVDDLLASDDYFLVGVLVRDGQATLDNFSLVKK